MGLDWSFALLPYGSQWRRQRKMFHQFFNSSTVEAYQPSQLSEARKFLVKLLDSPEQFMGHIRRFAHSNLPILIYSYDFVIRNVSATILRATYGIDEKKANCDYIHEVEECMQAVTDALTPGAYLVESIPQRECSNCLSRFRPYLLSTKTVKYVPEWFPGAGFKSFAKYWKGKLHNLKDSMYQSAKEAAVNSVERRV